MKVVSAAPYPPLQKRKDGAPTLLAVSAKSKAGPLAIEKSAPLLAMVAWGNPGCRGALAAAGANQAGVQRAISNWSVIYSAASSNDLDPATLAAVGIRETDFRNIDEVKMGGMGRGYFQIDLGQHPEVSAAQARDLNFSASFAANLLSSNFRAMASAHPNFTSGQMTQAALATYNMGFVNRRTRQPNISGNPNTIDVGTANNNYGSNTIAIQNDCLPRN